MQEPFSKVSNITVQKPTRRSISNFKYPHYSIEKKPKKDEEVVDISIHDYKEFLKIRKLDFISDLIVRDEELLKALLEEEDMRCREEKYLQEKILEEERERA